MGTVLRYGIARAQAALSTWALKDVLHRPAANFPGKFGLVIDPQLIADLAGRIGTGSVVVVGTNGKTTVTNMLADALEAAGKKVACNRTGANLDSGVATALLQAGTVDWAVLESDELWLAKVTPQLKPRFVVLLNLFRDQLDRMGEIEHIQESIARALAASPRTTFLYNCDDPLCQAVADAVGNETVPFGIEGALGLAQNEVADAGLCQKCSHPLEYRWRQYGQLGSYRCPNCGFSRPEPVFAGTGVSIGEGGVELDVRAGSYCAHARSRQAGAYTAYNLLAVCAAAAACGAGPQAAERAIWDYSPKNGRLQRYEADGCPILLNLAKNPTGFNQNLRIVQAEPGSKAAAFFVNDKEADGHDISWIWDVDFQELAGTPGFAAYAGGIRRNDVQVRLKHAGLRAPLVDGAADFAARAHAQNPEAKLFAIANYTALPQVKSELDRMEHIPAPHGGPLPAEPESPGPQGGRPRSEDSGRQRIVIAHLYPELLNLYGDGGNVTVLANRAKWRGIDAEIRRFGAGDELDLEGVDIVFLGGGPDKKQLLASRELLAQAGVLRAYVEDDGALLAICGGYQLLGRTWITGDEEVEGLSVIDAETRRAPGGSHNRLVGNIVLESPLASLPVVGYENHAGRTYLGPGCAPFGRVMGRCGKGNNGQDGQDGALYRNVVATYLHGPLLAKNPEVADFLIGRALDRRARKEGRESCALQPLDDAEERAANAFMCDKLGIRRR